MLISVMLMKKQRKKQKQKQINKTKKKHVCFTLKNLLAVPLTSAFLINSIL